MVNDKAVVLIMPATITPPDNCPDLHRKDPAVRLNDYCKALEFYLTISTSIIERIIFVENSNSDLEPLKRISYSSTHDKVVEFISFPNGNDFPPEYGKGYGEMLMLNFALDNSKIIKPNDVFWKATGRLVCNNIAQLISGSPESYDVYCDLHNSYKLLSLNEFFDPRFYSFTLNGYNKFFRLSAKELEYVHIELLYYQVLQRNVARSSIVPRFRIQPDFSGFCGADNADYYTLKKRMQRQCQQVMRFITPWFWI